MTSGAGVSELERHQYRREQRIATVSVLVGSRREAQQIWTIWSRNSGCAPLVVDIKDSDRLGIIRLQQNVGNLDLKDALIVWAASEMGIEPHRLNTRLNELPQPLRHAFLHNHLVDKDSIPTAALAMEVLSKDEATSLDSLIRNCRDSRAFVRLCDAISELNSVGSASLLVEIQDNDFDLKTMVQTTDHLADFSMAFPMAPIACSFSRENWNCLLKQAPESRGKAILRDSVIDVFSTVEEKIGRPLEFESDLSSSLNFLRKSGASGENIQTLRTVARDLTRAYEQSIEQQEKARSRVERFLFDLLSNISETSGLFALNERLPIQFGRNRSMEVDLFSKTLKLVVEIDGYYHFRSKEDYRRDRTKDYLLQKHGHFVLRFHADDVVWDLERIIGRLKEAVRLRLNYMGNDGGQNE